MTLKLSTLSALTLLLGMMILPASSMADAFVNPSLRASNSPLWNARVDGVDADAANLSVTDCPQSDSDSRAVCQGSAFSLKVNDPGLRTKVKAFHVGDHIRIDFDANHVVQEIGGASFANVSRGYRLTVMAGCAVALFIFAIIATLGKPLKLIVGFDNRYSNSKLQAALWFWILASTYLAALYLRISEAGMDFLGGISIPQNLLLLSGMSAITFTGAKAITTAKVNAAANPVLQPGAVAVPVANADPKNALADGQESFWRDVFQNDVGDFDFGDFQMVVVTMMAAGIYVLAAYHYLAVIDFTRATALPDVDTTILASFGLGQGAYLAKKAAGNIGST